jgi:hypothetical protein
VGGTSGRFGCGFRIALDVAQFDFGVARFGEDGHLGRSAGEQAPSTQRTGLLYSAPDGLCIGSVVFVANVGGLDKLALHEFDMVSGLGKLPRPVIVMCAAACFHANQTRRAVGEILQKPRALDLSIDNLARSHIQVMHLKDVFCYIYTILA